MRRPRTIRARLALAYALAVFVSLLFYAAWVYVLFRGELSEQLDARLEEDYEVAEHGFRENAAGDLAWLVEPHGDERPSEAPFAEIRDGSGRVLLRRPDPDPTDRAEHRVLDVAFEHDGRSFVARVGRSEAGIRQESGELLVLLLLGLLPMSGAAWLAGWWLSGRTLAPIRHMTERARAISADRLSERLPVAQPEDELGRLAQVFNEGFARLEDSFDRLRRFTADASHEMRTPLATMTSVGELALRGDGDAREAIASMLEEGEHLRHLVDDLLTLSRADAGKAEADLETLDLGALVGPIVEDGRVLAAERGQEVLVEDPGGVKALGDRRWISLAVLNLLQNAVQHAPEGSRITVVLSVRAGAPSIEVRDEGHGIAPEHVEKIFERFYRVDPARHGRGAGLGLAIARWAVEASGGRLEVESTPGRGSTFRIALRPPS